MGGAMAEALERTDVARSTVGRQEAFMGAVDEHYPALVHRLALVLGDEETARDVAQDTYLRAFEAWDRFAGSDVRAWLYTIGLRLAFNERRRLRRRLAALIRTEPRRTAEPFDPDLRSALDRLDARTRAAILLTSVDGYTLREVGSILDAPEGTVGSWLSRGRARLREELGREA